MSEIGDFDSFVHWMNTLISQDEFASRERDYKLELSDRFRETAQGDLSDESILSWFRDPANNVVRWNTLDTVSKKAAPGEFAEVVGRLLSEGALGQRIDEFGAWLHGTTGVAAGEQTTLASALLMGLDAAEHPPYKTTAIQTCMRLAGRQGSSGPPAERYMEFLAFCDELIEALAGHHGTSVDRLDVQGACWMIGACSAKLIKQFLPDHHAEFEIWRGNGRIGPPGSSVLTWWVNQGATYRQEHDGSYIWAPQLTKGGNAVAHHKAVFAVREGDRIVHYANGHIRAIGTATIDGHESDRPSDLPDGSWGQDGYRAGVDYQELDEPVPLAAIDATLRSAAGGPFNSSGGVNQGYLFSIPDSIRDHIAELLLSPEDSPTVSRAWVVYVGSATESNLNFSLPLGRWGWKRTQDYYDQLHPGDTFIFATGYTGGSPQVSADEWTTHGIGRLITCRTTSGVYQDATPFWPDEADDLSYPFRVDLDPEDDNGASSFAFVDQRFGGPVSEAIRKSAINQGRAEIVTIDGPTAVQPLPFDEVIASFVETTRRHGLNFGSRHEMLLRSFVTALATKPFVILTGLSGSGKTRLAQAFGHWVGAARVVAVRPDWTSPDSLFGFENALSEPTDDGRYAWNVPETLRFILEARDNPTQPHVLLLDEMNLAHVERYFADVLSGMESKEPVLPDLVCDDAGAYRSRSATGSRVPLPENLFVVGTVNIDETTYMFSPKVLDRANTFEFRVETEDLVATEIPTMLSVAEPGAAVGFLAAARDRSLPVNEMFAGWMRDVHQILAASDREFGHRTFQDALRFASLLNSAGEPDPLVALDLQVAQKVLPRLHGSRRELSHLLDRFGGFCFIGPDNDIPADFDCAAELPDGSVAALPISYDKLHRMAKRLRDNHFVSFAE